MQLQLFSSQSCFKKLMFSLPPNPLELEAIKTYRPDHVLLSFALWQNRSIQKDFIERIGYRPKTIVIDSGAFSFQGEDSGINDLAERYISDPADPFCVATEIRKDLFAKPGTFKEGQRPGLKTNFYNYLRWLIRNREAIDYVVAMDEIGDPLMSQFAYAAMWMVFRLPVLTEAGWEPVPFNFVPVFHYGDDLTYLERYVAAGATYIGLGGSAFRTRKERVRWVLPILEKYPHIKFHLFGTNDEKLIKALPGLYSADGSRWISAGMERWQKGENRLAATVDELRRRSLYAA